ncbi:class E sortase [Arthrobacter sp. UYEF3]|uniref:class E sortase n=1 Tax=Arthrobacter sp. UYEF3 TaxID=1756365 RepID=UPI00339274CC
MSRTLQIGGELFLTAGVVLLLFVAWQLWWTNLDADARQREVVRNFARGLSGPAHAVASQPEPGPGQGNARPPAPAVASEPEPGAMIGVVYVPRFGTEYARPIVQGTTPAVLDSLGLGHYEGTAMPGAAGNFALAGHRQTHGAVLDNIDTLVPGDGIYVQTRDGYYIYRFRNSEIVLPSATDVLLPVPRQPSATTRDGYLTMTSCNPRFGSQERIIAYSLLESWQPAAAGPPAEIAAQVARTVGGG